MPWVYFKNEQGEFEIDVYHDWVDEQTGVEDVNIVKLNLNFNKENELKELLDELESAVSERLHAMEYGYGNDSHLYDKIKSTKADIVKFVNKLLTF